MWWWLCVTEWTPMSLTECPERFERITSAKILTGIEMVQNKKRSLNPWFSTYRKQAKKTHRQNMLPVMKKGRVNQRVKPRAQRRESKVMEKVFSHSRPWNPIKELPVFVWGDPWTAPDWELLCNSHFPPFLNWSVYGSFPMLVPTSYIGCVEPDDVSL